MHSRLQASTRLLYSTCYTLVIQLTLQSVLPRWIQVDAGATEQKNVFQLFFGMRCVANYVKLYE